jgi:hypothetical protein
MREKDQGPEIPWFIASRANLLTCQLGADWLTCYLTRYCRWLDGSSNIRQSLPISLFSYWPWMVHQSLLLSISLFSYRLFKLQDPLFASLANPSQTLQRLLASCEINSLASSAVSLSRSVCSFWQFVNSFKLTAPCHQHFVCDPFVDCAWPFLPITCSSSNFQCFDCS